MADKTFNLQIISPTRVFFDEAVDMVEMKTTEGEIGVLAGHIPLTTILEPGVLRIKTDGGERRKRAGSDCHGCSDGRGGIFRSREHRRTYGSTFHGTGECEPAHRPADLEIRPTTYSVRTRAGNSGARRHASPRNMELAMGLEPATC